MDRGLTIRQVADLLGVSRKVVYRLVNSGSLTGRRIGKNSGTVRILESDLKAYLDGAVIQPAAPNVAKRPPVRYAPGTQFKFFPLEET